jgi:hypothetical protein
MSIWQLGIGDVVAMLKARVVHGNSKEDVIKLDFKAKPKRRMLFLYLGDEPVDGSAPLDCKQRLRDLGWVEKNSEVAD